MSAFWQTVIIVGAVALACAYLTYYYVRRKKRGGCASCRLMSGELQKRTGDSDRKITSR